MNVGFAGPAPSAEVGALAAALRERLAERGHVLVDGDLSTARLVFNSCAASAPAAHWRRQRADQFAVSLLAISTGFFDRRDGSLRAPPSDVLAAAYPALLRTLSNAVIAVAPDGLALVTPEMGLRPLPGERCEAVLEAVMPLAGARFAFDNDVRDDLPPAACAPGVAARQLAEGGRRLAALGLLPSVVALDGLPPEDRRLLRVLFGLEQISYGNLSVREPDGGFWMTGRGVDKGKLEKVGRDLFLVVGHDEEAGRVTVRVPPGERGGRVSVDAIEHALLYEAFPAVGAVVHVHAWMEGIDSTRQSWPCGTVELAREVRDLVAAQPDPANAAIGLRNHGVTLTGPTLDVLFGRVEGRLLREVPAS